jgi:hypothetical protein
MTFEEVLRTLQDAAVEAMPMMTVAEEGFGTVWFALIIGAALSVIYYTRYIKYVSLPVFQSLPF